MRLIAAHDEMQPGDINRMTPVFTAVQSSISGVLMNGLYRRRLYERHDLVTYFLSLPSQGREVGVAVRQK